MGWKHSVVKRAFLDVKRGHYRPEMRDFLRQTASEYLRSSHDFPEFKSIGVCLLHADLGFAVARSTEWWHPHIPKYIDAARELMDEVEDSNPGETHAARVDWSLVATLAAVAIQIKSDWPE